MLVKDWPSTATTTSGSLKLAQTLILSEHLNHAENVMVACTKNVTHPIVFLSHNLFCACRSCDQFSCHFCPQFIIDTELVTILVRIFGRRHQALLLLMRCLFSTIRARIIIILCRGTTYVKDVSPFKFLALTIILLENIIVLVFRCLLLLLVL